MPPVKFAKNGQCYAVTNQPNDAGAYDVTIERSEDGHDWHRSISFASEAIVRSVRADRARYRAHWQRTLAAELRYPIHLLATTPVLRMLDGVHRLLKSDDLGCGRILACRVDRDQLKKIVIPR